MDPQRNQILVYPTSSFQAVGSRLYGALRAYKSIVHKVKYRNSRTLLVVTAIHDYNLYVGFNLHYRCIAGRKVHKMNQKKGQNSYRLISKPKLCKIKSHMHDTPTDGNTTIVT